jgi:hypothetical protein
MDSRGAYRPASSLAVLPGNCCDLFCGPPGAHAANPFDLVAFLPSCRLVHLRAEACRVPGTPRACRESPRSPKSGRASARSPRLVRASPWHRALPRSTPRSARELDRLALIVAALALDARTSASPCHSSVQRGGMLAAKDCSPCPALIHWRASGQQAHQPAPGRARAKSKENLMARCRAHTFQTSRPSRRQPPRSPSRGPAPRPRSPQIARSGPGLSSELFAANSCL